jgi:hypothetical protein
MQHLFFSNSVSYRTGLGNNKVSCVAHSIQYTNKIKIKVSNLIKKINSTEVKFNGNKIVTS